MNKIIIFSVIGLLIVSGFGVIGLQTDPAIKQHVTYDFKNVKISESEDFVTLDMDETDSVLMNPNKPMMPYSTKTFTYPVGTEISSVECTPTDIQIQSLPKMIKPTAQPVLPGMEVSDSSDESVSYSFDTYPNMWYDYDVGMGLKDNQRCVYLKIRLFPVQYQPAQDTIRVASDFDIDIEYKQTNQQVVQQTDEDEYDLIILTPAKFLPALTPLADHKNDRDVSTKIVTLNNIYSGLYFATEGRDNPEKVKYFIKNAIEQWNTKNVLLIGGVGEFPTRDTHVYVDYNEGDDEVFITDVYYADVYDGDGNFVSWDSNENDVFGEFNWSNTNNFDEVDLYPDVYLGRLPVLDSEELTGVVNKIITYETGEAWKQDWFSEIVVIGGDTVPSSLGDESNVDEGEYLNQAVLDIMTGFTPDKIWDSNYRLSWFNPSGVDNINNGINSGCGFVDWAGHGSPTVWTTYPHNGEKQILPTPTGIYRNKQILNLENNEKLPIVVTGACSVGKFSVPDCFTWSFVKNPNGGGIASLGATSLSWGMSGPGVVDWLGGRIHLSFYQAYADGAETFGQMWADGLSEYIRPNMDGGHHKTGEQWEPFGDPTLQITEPSAPPLKPAQPTGPSEGKVDEKQNYSTVTTDPENDSIYYKWDWGDGTYSAWIGPFESGETCEVTHVWEQRGSYPVSVQARDDNGKLSEWSEPLPTSMPKDRLFFHPFFEFFKQHFNVFSFFENMFENRGMV